MAQVVQRSRKTKTLNLYVILSIAASIMTGSSGMHGGGGGLNGIKLEGHNGGSIAAAAAGGGGGSAAANYYCNSYTPPDHGLLTSAAAAAAYSESEVCLTF